MLCATKALLDATPSLSDLLRPIVSPTTSIVLLQNGVGAEIPPASTCEDRTDTAPTSAKVAREIDHGIAVHPRHRSCYKPHVAYDPRRIVLSGSRSSGRCTRRGSPTLARRIGSWMTR